MAARVADGNELSAKQPERTARPRGNQTRTAYDGAEAVAVAEEFRPEVLLLGLDSSR